MYIRADNIWDHVSINIWVSPHVAWSCTVDVAGVQIDQASAIDVQVHSISTSKLIH